MKTKLQQQRQKYHRRRAENLAAASEEAWRQSQAALEGIPPGQPVLVGHHSERRHRAALRRSDRHMQKCVEAHRKARGAQYTADHAGHAILGRDPEGVEAMRAKLASLEQKRDIMKAINKVFRRKKGGGWEGVYAAAEAGEFPMQAAINAKERMDKFPRLFDVPFPGYSLKNLGANIRRYKDRLAQLEQKRGMEQQEIEFDGGTVEIDPHEDRIRLYLDDRLSKEKFREIMRGYGFRWSRKYEALQRHLNWQGGEAVKNAVRDLFDIEINLPRL